MLCLLSGLSIDVAAFSNGNLTGKVTAIIDGNTLEFFGDDNQTYRVLLAGVDSPELGQDYGEKAKEFLGKISLKKTVTVQLVGKDRKGNYLAIILINGKVDARIELLKEGLAWTAEKDPKEDLESYRIWAQRKGRGLWKEENPTPPWTYRRQQSMMQAKSR
jgi:endonuclease YncB( thermonuclease family)